MTDDTCLFAGVRQCRINGIGIIMAGWLVDEGEVNDARFPILLISRRVISVMNPFQPLTVPLRTNDDISSVLFNKFAIFG